MLYYIKLDILYCDISGEIYSMKPLTTEKVIDNMLGEWKCSTLKFGL